MRHIYTKVALAYFVIATASLIILAFILLGIAFVEVATGLFRDDPVATVLSSISLLVIGFAVVETAKFIAEEEIIRQRELRSTRESRRSITKFITIIVIAASLEALVMVFQATREGIQFAIYPAALFFAAMSSLVALGAYQWMSSRIGGEEGAPSARTGRRGDDEVTDDGDDED
ncbi:GNAT family acetyltransferase [Acuticoccus sp. M5D2P5]|uniref:GNAT family acetyltransferase n=1 Tax=Acuticoccus kalidii TaxID=2910977 RepID=UPI001F32F66A|nr:GNAT family acetyltransferase [Acuticoccus kalidii]MCF3931824.1 GNAT family acetyltransferase [Acuticoccus kalidii]